MKRLFTLLAFVFVASFSYAQMVEVTFGVDMNGVSGFDPAQGVFVAGAFQGWTPADGALADDDGNGVWTRTYMLAPGTYEYKFGIGNDWGVNEGGGLSADCGVDDNNGAFNRVIDVVDAEVVGFMYDSCEETSLPVSVTNVSTIANVAAFPNPMTASATITFDNASNDAHDILVTNVAGQVIRSYQGITANAVTIERGTMNPGLYFVTFVNEKGETGSLKLSVR